jgi:transposase
MTCQILKQSVGLDVSKDSLAACFCQSEKGKALRIVSSRSFKTSAGGFQQMHKWIEKHRSDQGVELRLLMESTGVYYEEAAYFLKSKGYGLSVVLPNKTSAYAKSLDQKSKTDKTDAQMLAQMALERDLPVWEPPSPTMLKIKQLCRERAALLDQKTVIGNRLHAYIWSYRPQQETLKRTRKSIKDLQQQIKQVEAQIAQTIDSDPFIKERIDKVCSLPGVGIITAATIAGETNGFTLFKNKAQLVCYAGYDVLKNQSGTTLDSPGRISKRGNARIRKALHFPAIVAVKKNGKMKKCFDRVLDKTQIKMKAYVAIQRKLLILIYTLYKNNQTFDPLFESVKKTSHTQTN